MKYVPVYALWCVSMVMGIFCLGCEKTSQAEDPYLHSWIFVSEYRTQPLNGGFARIVSAEEAEMIPLAQMQMEVIGEAAFLEYINISVEDGWLGMASVFLFIDGYVVGVLGGISPATQFLRIPVFSSSRKIDVGTHIVSVSISADYGTNDYNDVHFTYVAAVDDAGTWIPVGNEKYFMEELGYPRGLIAFDISEGDGFSVLNTPDIDYILDASTPVGTVVRGVSSVASFLITNPTSETVNVFGLVGSFDATDGARSDWMHDVGVQMFVSTDLITPVGSTLQNVYETKAINTSFMIPANSQVTIVVKLDLTQASSIIYDSVRFTLRGVNARGMTTLKNVSNHRLTRASLLVIV